MNELARTHVEIPLTQVPLKRFLLSSSSIEVAIWSLAKVETLSTDTHATPKQKFSLEHVCGVLNADGEKKGTVILLEFLGA